MNDLAEFHRKFDTECYSYLDDKIRDAKKIHKDAAGLLAGIKDFLLSGGKRFRPALFFHAYGSTGKTAGIDSLRVSFIFELVHTFALIHDDIIDNAPLRRGSPTVYKSRGVGAAILAGNTALMIADELFGEALSLSRLPPDALTRIRTQYDAYKQELMVGQYLDWLHIPETGKIMLLKTSRYSFVHPATLGFLFGGAPEEARTWEPVLEKLGMLFQLKDDYEGVFGDERLTGKSATSDLQEGKNTRIVALFRENASVSELARFKAFFGKKDVPGGEFEWFLGSVRKKGTDEKIRGEIREGIAEIEHGISLFKESRFSRLVLELCGIIRSFSP